MYEADYARVVGSKKHLFFSILKFLHVQFILIPVVLVVLGMMSPLGFGRLGGGIAGYQPWLVPLGDI